MRRVLTALLLSTAAAAPASAQMAVGITGGYVSSNASINPDISGKSSRSGFALGAVLDFGAGKSAGFAPEAFYIDKGISVASGSAAGAFKVAYAEVPLLFRLALGAPRKTHPFITAGPTVALNLSCSLSGSAGSVTVNQPCDSLGPNAGVKSTDFGLMFGAGVASKTSSLSVRYEIGLSDIDKADPPTIKNNAWLILLGVKF